MNPMKFIHALWSVVSVALEIFSFLTWVVVYYRVWIVVVACAFGAFIVAPRRLERLLVRRIIGVAVAMWLSGGAVVISVFRHAADPYWLPPNEQSALHLSIPHLPHVSGGIFGFALGPLISFINDLATVVSFTGTQVVTLYPKGEALMVSGKVMGVYAGLSIAGFLVALTLSTFACMRWLRRAVRATGDRSIIQWIKDVTRALDELTAARAAPAPTWPNSAPQWRSRPASDPGSGLLMP